ncbi:hypothetical protein, partial [Alistipes onderdonkii]|uniref:hypothetical protein n=1 Tax=Alistipes onderdonkii TaxID=328813 RepID=UPI001E5EA3A5
AAGTTPAASSVFVYLDGNVRSGGGRRLSKRNKIRIFSGFLRIYLFCLFQTAKYRRKTLV